jgi:hypothetical protein
MIFVREKVCGVMQVVQRKNGDSQKRDLEVNKSIADVMIARSDGTSRYVVMYCGNHSKREFFIHDLLVRIRFIIEIILVSRLGAMRV